jgi:hypothetical protein
VSNIASVSGLSIFDFSSFYSNVSLVWIYYVLSLEDRLILLWFFYNYYHIIPPTLITTAEKSMFHFLLKLGMIQTMVLLYLLRQTFMQLLSA